MIKTRKLTLCLLLTLVLLAIGAMITGEAFAWYNFSWSYRQMITINSSMVPGDLTNFPVLVKVTDTNLRVSPGGKVGKTNGGDILFTSADAVTKLDHEIESYNSVTGELIAWVEVPLVSSTSDTVIYMYYGNSGASNQWNINGTWDSNYKGVWHLHNAASPATDSTGNANNGTQSGGVTFGAAGKINSAISLDGADDFLNMGDPANGSLDFGTGAFCVEFWIKRSGGIGTWQPLVNKDQDPPGWTVMFTGLPATANLILFMTRLPGGGGSGDGLTSTTAITDTTNWHHIVATRNASGDKWIYIDGVAEPTTSNDTSYDVSSIADFKVSRSPTFAFDGFFDEVRASNTKCSADWVEASYNNQNNPSSFLSFGAPAMFTPVPTMNEWGMIIFVILAGLGSIYYMRRKRIES